jgi:PilZ domain-containing protein
MPIIPSSTGDWRDEFETSVRRSVREARHQARRMCHIPVRFWADGDRQERSAVIRNLSEIGAFLETDPLPVGTRLHVKLVHENGVDVRPCEVMWLENPDPSARSRRLWGIGVRFLTRATT